jgi:hypothetical protein
MTASNTYARFASVALPSADGCRSSSVVAFGCVLIVIGAYCFCPSVFAQTPDSRAPDEPTKSWTATTGVKGNNLNSAQIIESHSQNGNQTVDKRSVQIRGVDGHLEPYQDIETETLQVDAPRCEPYSARSVMI